ncbi:MAG: hypothetical protein JWO30_4082, partial [Fibrobacteres bacterium]|nr:hypothetical protein [Fibrobacterota bacterium]
LCRPGCLPLRRAILPSSRSTVIYCLFLILLSKSIRDSKATGSHPFSGGIDKINRTSSSVNGRASIFSFFLFNRSRKGKGKPAEPIPTALRRRRHAPAKTGAAIDSMLCDWNRVRISGRARARPAPRHRNRLGKGREAVSGRRPPGRWLARAEKSPPKSPSSRR